MKIPDPPSTVCRLVRFTGGVKGILVQYVHGKSDQSVGVLPIPLVLGGKSNQSLVVLPTPLTTAGKMNQKPKKEICNLSHRGSATDWLDLPHITRGIGWTPTDWSYFP